MPSLVTETASYIELLNAIGFPALIFIIWYIYHRAENLKWNEHFKAQSQVVREMIEQSREQNKQQFTLWQEQANALHAHGAQLARLETKIDHNEFCPIIKEKRK